jgi:hypothetical protein
MGNHVPVLRGLTFAMRIEPLRGGGVIGSLEDRGTIVFESEFPCYKDAYWALMDMDAQEFLEQTEEVKRTCTAK